MTTVAIALSLSLAAVTIGTALGWALAAVALPIVRRRDWSPRSRANLIAQLRTLPLSLAIILAVAQLVAFLRFEAGRAETVGPLLLILAASGLALCVEAVLKTTVSLRQTRQLMTLWRSRSKPLRLPNWTAPAWVVRLPFPIALIAGVRHHELFIAQQVVRACTAQEMAAIVAHERAHVSGHDTLVGTLFLATPGSRLMTRIAHAYESAWRLATEHAADQMAARVAGPLEMASALTKVARLATRHPAGVATSSLINESALDARVMKLIEAAGSPHDRRCAWLPALLVLIAAFATQTPAVALRLHELFEMLVRAR